MYQLESYPEVLSFLKTYSYAFKSLPAFINVFCPYCNDSTRRSGRLPHGHLYISKDTNYAHCFRCELNTSFTNVLETINFPNTGIINEILRLTIGITYVKTKNRPNNTVNKFSIINEHVKFIDNDYHTYMQFFNYLQYRSPNLICSEFNVIPSLTPGVLVISFINANGTICNNRVVPTTENNFNPVNRYIKPSSTSDYYYFQNIFKSHEYTDIVICEGEIDCINLFRFSQFNNVEKYPKVFYLAIGSKAYISAMVEMVTTFLLVGEYTIHIILDNPKYDKYININKLKFISSRMIGRLNTKLIVKYYVPMLKDVSELVMLEQV